MIDEGNKLAPEIPLCLSIWPCCVAEGMTDIADIDAGNVKGIASLSRVCVCVYCENGDVCTSLGTVRA